MVIVLERLFFTTCVLWTTASNLDAILSLLPLFLTRGLHRQTTGCSGRSDYANDCPSSAKCLGLFCWHVDKARESVVLVNFADGTESFRDFRETGPSNENASMCTGPNSKESFPRLQPSSQTRFVSCNKNFFRFHSSIILFTITAEILARSLANFYCQ